MSNKILSVIKNRSFLLLVLLIGTYLRFYMLADKSVWFDEACSLSFAQSGWSDILNHRYMAKPLYFIILKLWVSLFGYAEFPARALSAIFGVASIPLVYFLGKELFNKNTGVISAFIFSLSAYQIYYAQQIRNYSLFLFLSALSMLLFMRLLRSNKLTLLVFYILTTVLLVFTHPFGLFIIIIQNLFFAVFRERSLRTKYWFTVDIIFCVALLFLAFIFISHRNCPSGNEIGFLVKPTSKSLIETLETFSYAGPRQAHGGLGFGPTGGRLIIPRILTFLFCFLAVFCFLPAKKQDESEGGLFTHRRSKQLLLMWFFLPIFGAYILSYIILPIYLSRFLIPASVAFYIMIAHGIEKISMLKYKLVVITAIVICMLFSLDILYHPGCDGNWRKLSHYVKYNIKEGDIIIFAPTDQILPFWYYYKFGDTTPLKGIDKEGKYIEGNWRSSFYDGANFVYGIKFNPSKDSIEREVIGLSKNKNDIWFINSPFWIGQDISKYIHKILAKHYSLISKMNYYYDGVEVSRYTLRDDQS